MEALLSFVQDEFIEKKELPEFGTGDTLTVYYQIREGNKVRTQFFKGVVIQIKGQGLSKTFTIRKMSGVVGVERIFPMNMPGLEKIEINDDQINSIIDLLIHDKKNSHGKINFILLKDIAKPVYDVQVKTEFIKESFKYYLS